MSNLVKEGRAKPTKLSEWLRLGVEDLQRIPAECSTPQLQFTPKMLTFGQVLRFENEQQQVCYGCLATFALLGGGLLQVEELRQLSETRLVEGDHGYLMYALDYLRMGELDLARGHFAEYEQYGLHGRELPASLLAAAKRVYLEYLASKDDRASDEAYLALADELAAIGE